MTVAMMRKWVVSAYNNPTWMNKVAMMPDIQVIAIYRNMQKRGVFNKDKSKKIEPSELVGHQMNIFDYLNDKEEEKKNEV